MKAMGGGQQTAAPPAITMPKPPVPGIEPNSKPTKKGMQESFLSGVAGSAAQAAGGAAVGKTLLGQ